MKFPLSVLAAFSAVSLSTQAAVINFTNQVIDGNPTNGQFEEVNNAALSRSDINSGSGGFRDLYRLQGSPTESGYNRTGTGITGDQSIPGGFNPIITVGELGTDSTGDFYVFAVDVNEQNSVPSFISLDAFAVYTGGSSDPATLPADRAGLDATFDIVWDLDEGEDNVVLLDNAIGGAGSGSADLLIYIPVTRFDTAASTDLVYVYSEFGGFSTDFNSESGHENIAALTNEISNTFTVPPIPEPSSILLTILGALGLVSVRRRA